MGVVYKAVDTNLGRIVALKCLSPALVEHPEALKRFAREAHATCAMNHPHILTFFDVDIPDGVHYIAGRTGDRQYAKAAFEATSRAKPKS